jgi:hypothetical protein
MQQAMAMQQAQIGARNFPVFSGAILPGMMPQPFMPSVGPSMQM